MDTKYKIISIILVIILLSLGVIIGINYKNEIDNNEFKEILTNASDIENITDKHYTEMFSGRSVSINEFKTFAQSNVENTSNEISILKEFRDKTSNQTQKEYLDIEINRLEQELRAYEKDIDSANQYERYLNGEITASKYTDLATQINDDVDRIDDETSIIKDDAITYLDNHPDLKQTINELNIDEDFYSNELGGTSGNGGVYITK